MAARIIALFPPHNTFVEVFGGAGAVILSKSPATLDVYNDKYDELVSPRAVGLNLFNFEDVA